MVVGGAEDVVGLLLSGCRRLMLTFNSEEGDADDEEGDERQERKEIKE